jgi:hypothetical protein
MRKTIGPAESLMVRGYAVTAYGSQSKAVDTVMLADAGKCAFDRDRATPGVGVGIPAASA